MITRTFVLTAAAAAVVAGPVSADEREDDLVRELQAQVAELKTTVDDLKEADDDWLTEHRADEICGIVHDVLADADTRASLLGSGMTAGWDKNFFLASSDGNVKLNIKGQVQVRHVYNTLDNGFPGVGAARRFHFA